MHEAYKYVFPAIVPQAVLHPLHPPKAHPAPGRKCRLRCRRCGRIHKAETLDTGYCPRCFRHDGVKRCDFTETNIIDVSFALYRCEDCGVLIHAG